MLNILIADDHSIIRFGVNLLIQANFPEANVYECASFEAVIKTLGAVPINLILLDINIPGGDTLRMIDAIKLKQPLTRILMFTAYNEHIFAARYLQAGAHGYLVKDSSEEELGKAIRTVLNGEIYVSESIKQEVLQKLAGGKNIQTNYLDQLSNRETEVMQLLIKGHSTSEICRMLNLQPSTISTYKAKIFEKLGVKNLVELIEKYKMLY
jgi:DNA-binding NarL/FixJ family response regulator